MAIYLVISTINLWTVERQPWFAHLRTIGATPAQLVKIIFSEALVLGLIGALIGYLCGQGAAVVTSALTAQTVQDFYANIPLLGRRFQWTLHSSGLAIRATFGRDRRHPFGDSMLAVKPTTAKLAAQSKSS